MEAYRKGRDIPSSRELAIMVSIAHMLRVMLVPALASHGKGPSLRAELGCTYSSSKQTCSCLMVLRTRTALILRDMHVYPIISWNQILHLCLISCKSPELTCPCMALWNTPIKVIGRAAQVTRKMRASWCQSMG